jgi:hypothetical protein
MHDSYDEAELAGGRCTRSHACNAETRDYDLWLDPGITDSERVVHCLKPFDSTLMKKYPVSTRVNRPENDDQECAREVPIAAPAPRLL